MRILENEALRLSLSDKGAELCSVVDKAEGTERLWSADPAVWNRHAPILFPFVGKVTNGKYRIGEREYEMKTQHGFARDMVFSCIEETGDSVTHRLLDTEKTREIYPYAFCLTVRHALVPDDPRLLRIEWTVENHDTAPMYYSIGGHPGFLPPPGVKKEDCFLMFPGAETLRCFSANREGFALPALQKELPLDRGYAAYREDIPETWIFPDSQVGAVAIAGPDRQPYVTLYCEGFPLLAVWANPKGPFICLEPWYGRTDDAGFRGSLAEKPGIQRLGPEESQVYAYQIRFHRRVNQ